MRLTMSYGSRPPAAATLVSGAVFLAVLWWRDSLYTVYPAEWYLKVSFILEFFSILTALLIFGEAWLTRISKSGEQSDSDIFYVWCVFVAAAAVVDIFHVFSYQGTTAAVAVEETGRGALLRIGARAIVAAGFGSVLFLAAFRVKRRREKLVAKLSLLAPLLAFGVVLAACGYRPSLSGGPGLQAGSFAAAAGMDVLLAVVFFTAAAFVYRSRVSGGARIGGVWPAALILMAWSEISFVFSSSIYDSFNLLGHIYGAAGYVLLFYAMFVYWVKYPDQVLARTQGRLQANEERWRLALEGSNAVLWDIDLVSGRVFLSQHWTEVTGFAMAAMPKTTEELMNTCHPDDLARVTQALQEHLGKKKPYYDVEHRIRCRTGYKWIACRGQAVWDETGRPVRIVGSEVDIDARQTAEDELRDSEARYRALIEQSSDGIALVEVGSRRILEANARFSSMIGYSLEETRQLTVYDIACRSREEVDEFYRNIPEYRDEQPVIVRSYRRKNGQRVEAEFSGSLIQYQGKQIYAVNLRDITREKRQQEALLRDVELAGAVQRGQLPGDYVCGQVHIRTIYQPHHLVSGDSFDYVWNKERTILRGFVMDVTGHGVATALRTSALNVLFREVMGRDMPLVDKLLWVNRHARHYFSDDSFVAVICFEIDFIRRTLTYVSGGINYFLAFSRQMQGIVKVPGSLIGISPCPEFEQHSVAIHPGDVFCFLTDGITEFLTDLQTKQCIDFASTVEILQTVAQSSLRRDDASALCLKINSGEDKPVYFQFNGLQELITVRPYIHRVLEELAGPAAPLLNIAVNEAMNNALQHGASCGRCLSVMVRIHRMKENRVVIRIKHAGEGISDSQLAAHLSCEPADTMEQMLYEDSGRGLLIMQMAADKIFFNKKGNEVMLVKTLQSGRRSQNPA